MRRLRLVDEGNDQFVSEWNISSGSSSDENPLISDGSTKSNSSDDEYGSINKECENCSIERSEASEGTISKMDEATNTVEYQESTSVDNEASNCETVVDIPSSPSPPPQTQTSSNHDIFKRLISLNRASSFSHAMMNVALFSANANQLKKLMEETDESSSSIFFKFSFYLLISSLILQCLLKLFSIIASCCGCANPENSLEKAEAVKQIVVIITVIVTLINLSVTSFVFLENIVDFL